MGVYESRRTLVGGSCNKGGVYENRGTVFGFTKNRGTLFGGSYNKDFLYFGLFVRVPLLEGMPI